MFLQQIIPIILLIIFGTSVNSTTPVQPQKSLPTVIQGTIKNYEKYNQTKVVKLKRSVSDDEDLSREAKVRPDGTFEIKFNQPDKEKYVLAPFPNTHVYTNPGDSVKIIIDLDGARLTTFQGRTRSKNILLNKFYKEGVFNPGNNLFIPSLFDSSPNNVSPLEVLSKLDELQNKNDENLAEFISKHNISAEDSSLLKAMILRKNYENLLEYSLKKSRTIDGTSNAEPSKHEELAQFFNLLTTRLENNIESIATHVSVQKIMDMYLFYLLENKMGMHNTTIYERGNILTILDLLDQTHENNPFKEHLLYRLNTQFITVDPDYHQAHQDEFISKFTSDAFRDKIHNYIRQSRNEIELIQPMKNYKLDDLFVDDALTKAIKEAEGKKIYIDFWATWCSPCLEDMKKSREAVAEAEVNDDVVVIYVCVDNNESARKNFIRNNQIPGKHITIPGKATSKVMANFGNSGYPFQVIIGPSGNILAKGNQYRFTLPITQKILSYERP